MTSPEMRETKAYKTYLGYATGVTPLKKARKFKKPVSPKLTTISVSPKEPTRKSKRVKRPAKNSTNASTAGVVIRDTHKGIELLSEVELTEEAQYEEVFKKSLRDFHKTHPSGSGISDSGDDNTQSDKEKGSDSEHETDENEAGSESDQEENKEEVEDDEKEKEDKFVKTPSNYNSTDDEVETNVESKVEDNAEGDEEKGMDYTTNKFDDDVDERLNEPVNADEGFIQKEGTDGDMINVLQGNENLEIILNQVIEDAHVTISTVAKKTEVSVTSSSHSSDLAAKFLNSADIPTTDAEIVSLMDVHVHHEIPSNQTPTLFTVPILATNPLSALPNFASVFQFNNRVSALEKEVAELKKDDLLNTHVTALVDEHLDSRLGATRDEFMSYFLASITARITEQVKIQLPQILPKEVSSFAPPVIKSMVTESLEHAVIAKESSQPQSTYEVAASLT
ncbi:hypothetical protein Tco_0271983 [Tanacetum coccineum]